MNPSTERHEKGICLIFEMNTAHLVHRRALWALIFASAERLKSLFVQAKFTRTLFTWKIHVPNENNSANVLPTMKSECSTHRNRSQLFHSCLQRNIGSCTDEDFCDG